MKGNMQQRELERLHGLASLAKGNKTAVNYRGGLFYLTARLHDRREPLASFTNAEELERVLLLLALAEPVTPDALLQGKINLWHEQHAYAEKRKALVYEARKLNSPEMALQQQAIMEQAWAMREREQLCAKTRNWLDAYGILPVHVGLDDLEKHNPDAENADDPVPCADFDWLSNEFRCHDIRNFSAVYRRASAWPEQNFIAELRRFHTNNIRNAWQQLTDGQILPQMEEIREAGAYSSRGREMIRRIKAIIGPWSIPRPWPLEKKERKRRRTTVEATRHVRRLPAVSRQNDQAATA